MAEFGFVHLTDPHLRPAGERLYGLDPGERLRAAAADMARRHGPGSAAPAAFAVITGDLAHDGYEGAYALLREAVGALPFPVHLLLGNHDDRDAFRAAFPEAPVDAAGFVQQAVATPAGRFVMLDTHEPGQAGGVLCAARLGWLAERLAEGEEPVFLFLHHPPYRSGMPGMDRSMLAASEGLWAVLAPHRARLRHLFHGHTHRPIAGSWHGVPVSSLRGSSHQVALEFRDTGRVPGSQEPAAYAYVRVTPEAVVVHAHDFLDPTATFDL